jgi:hypothetical protein
MALTLLHAHYTSTYVFFASGFNPGHKQSVAANARLHSSDASNMICATVARTCNYTLTSASGPRHPLWSTPTIHKNRPDVLALRAIYGPVSWTPARYELEHADNACQHQEPSVHNRRSEAMHNQANRSLADIAMHRDYYEPMRTRVAKCHLPRQHCHKH